MKRYRFVVELRPVVSEDGSTSTFLFSADDWCTLPTDTPANTPVRGLLKNPGTLRRELFSGQRVTGAITPSWGNVVLANPAPNKDGAGELDDWIDYGLSGAEVIVRRGPVGAAYPSGYHTVYVAKCHSFVADAGEITIRLRDDLQLLDSPIVTEGFAGTGGIEGNGSAPKRKQFVAGDPGLIEPILIDAVKQIYYVQSTSTGGLHDTWKTTSAEIAPFDVFINGVEVTRDASNYGTEAELLASAPAAGYVKMYFGPDSASASGWKDGDVYFRLGSPAGGDVRVYAVGYPTDADYNANGGVAYGTFFAGALALRAGVALDDIGDAANSLAVTGLLVDDDRTYLDVLTDSATAYQGWYGFDRLGKFRAGYLLDPASTDLYYGCTPGLVSPEPDADSVSVYTFTEADMLSPLRRDPPAGMEAPAWTVAATAGDTWPSQIAGGATSTMRDYLTRKVWASYSGSAPSTRLANPGAGSSTVKMRARVIQNAYSQRLWLERWLALFAGKRHFYSFTVALSEDMLALDLHDCVTLQHRRFGLSAGVKGRIVSITIDCAASEPSIRFVLWTGTPGRYAGTSSAESLAFVEPAPGVVTVGGMIYGSVSMPAWFPGAAVSVAGEMSGTVTGGVGSGLMWYEAENTAPSLSVTGTPVTKRAEFMALLTVSGAETFEGFEDSEVLYGVDLTINGVTCTVDAPAAYVDDNTVTGRFNTTSGGVNFLVVGGDTDLLTLTFSTPISALGFYATDVGDFAGQVSITLHKFGGGTVIHNVAHTINGPNGSLMFIGFVDDTDTYTQIDITASTSAEAIGIDDLVVATAAQLA